MSEETAESGKPVERVSARPRSPIPPDTILIGKKPVMSYATAVMMHFTGGAKELTVKARGRAISRAVDVIEVVRRRFFGGKLSVRDVSIGTETVGEGGDARNVSTIEIKVEKVD
ncbi:MAG: DNA-binding protein Alba [Candidatus Bathyarchaeia archaeon]